MGNNKYWSVLSLDFGNMIIMKTNGDVNIRVNIWSECEYPVVQTNMHLKLGIARKFISVWKNNPRNNSEKIC